MTRGINYIFVDFIISRLLAEEKNYTKMFACLEHELLNNNKYHNQKLITYHLEPMLKFHVFIIYSLITNIEQIDICEQFETEYFRESYTKLEKLQDKIVWF